MPLTARDVMQTAVATIAQDASLLDAHRLFVDEEIHGAPVVDADGAVVGVLSTLDVLRAVQEEESSALGDATYFRELLEFSGPDWASGPEDFQNRLAQLRVGEAMTTSVVSVPPDATIAKVASTMRAHRIHRVLVADDGRLVGIITTFDLVALLEKG